MNKMPLLKLCDKLQSISLKIHQTDLRRLGHAFIMNKIHFFFSSQKSQKQIMWPNIVSPCICLYLHQVLGGVGETHKSQIILALECDEISSSCFHSFTWHWTICGENKAKPCHHAAISFLNMTQRAQSLLCS